MNSKLLLSLLVLAVSCSRISAQQFDEVDAVATKLPSHVRYLGCYKDAGKRDLNHVGKVAAGKMTPQYCYEVCRGKGYQYFGLQYMHYCFCGRHYGLYGKVPERQCHLKCSGDKSKICGASWRNNVYTTGLPADRLPSHVHYLGCYKDGGVRDLRKHAKNTPGLMTPLFCYRTCRKLGYQYFGLQYMHHCFCGKSYGLHGKVPERECNLKCSGNRAKICGAAWRNSVYTTGLAHEKLPRQVTYLGCFTDKPARDLRHHTGSSALMTPMMCYRRCKNKVYKYFGLQDATHCFCDNWYGKYKPKLPESACFKKCAGNRHWKCGAPWKNSIYSTGLGGPIEPTTEGGDGTGTGDGHGTGTGGGHGTGTGGGGTITETTMCVDPYTGKEHAVGDSWTSKSGGFCYRYTCGKKHGQPVRTDCKDSSGRCVRATASGNKFSCAKGSCECLLQGGHTYVRHRVTHSEK